MLVVKGITTHAKATDAPPVDALKGPVVRNRALFCVAMVCRVILFDNPPVF